MYAHIETKTSWAARQIVTGSPETVCGLEAEHNPERAPAQMVYGYQEIVQQLITSEPCHGSPPICSNCLEQVGDATGLEIGEIPESMIAYPE